MAGNTTEIEKIGKPAEGVLLETLREEVASLLGRRQTNFPGAQPVSFTSRHFLELQKEDYYLCEKTDGERFLLYFTVDPNSDNPEIHYLINRRNEYWWVPGLHFPKLEDPTFQKYHVDTILDGELVRDTYEDGTSELKYLVFDCLVINRQPLIKRPLHKRLGYFRDYIRVPYNAMYEKFPEEKPHRLFTMDWKETQSSYSLGYMFEKVLPQLPHGNDGLIFTCKSTNYQFGTDDHILKWKPPTENSVDFVLRFEWPQLDPDPDDPDRTPFEDYDAMPTFHLCVYYGQKDPRNKIPFATMYMEPSEWEVLKSLNQPLDETIVECNQDTQGRWRFHRLREDKPNANHISTVEKVLESIRDGVSKEELIRQGNAIRQAWKKRLAETEANDKKHAAAVAAVAAARRARTPPAPSQQDEATRRQQQENGNGDVVHNGVINGNGNGNGAAVVGEKRKFEE